MNQSYPGGAKFRGFSLRSVATFVGLVGFLVAAGLPAIGSAPVWATTCTLDCSGADVNASDCTISGTNTLTDGCTLYFNVNVTVTGTLQVADSAPTGFTLTTANGHSLILSGAGTLKARSSYIDLEVDGNFTTTGTGTINVGAPTSGFGGFFVVNANGACSITNSVAWRADGSGGTIELFCVGGSSGSTGLHATGLTAGDSPGFVWVSSQNNINLSGNLVANGLGSSSVAGPGGTIWVSGGWQQIALTGDVTANGNGAFGGAGGTILIGPLCFFGCSHPTAITLGPSSNLQATASGAATPGSITVTSDTGPVVMKDTVSTNATGTVGNGNAGDIEISGTSVTVVSAITANAIKDGTGGNITITASDGSLSIPAAGSVKANGATISTVVNGSHGGTITLSATGDVNLSGDLAATAAGGLATGGTITIKSDPTHALTIDSTSSITAYATSSGQDGNVSLCGRDVNLSGTITTSSSTPDTPGGSNTVKYFQTFTGGTTLSMQADALVYGGTGNVIECPCALSGGSCATPLACASTANQPILTGTYSPTVSGSTPTNFSTCN